MYRRQLSKLLRYTVLLIFYLSVYFVISYAIAPEVTVSFVSEDVRVGDKFVLMYLVAPKSPAFTDTDGAEIFDSRCGKCFITNNKGFLPLREYDAILTVEEGLVTKSASGEKMFNLEATRQCVRNKLKGCAREPRITSRTTKKIFDLCNLCKHLHSLKEPKL